MDVTQYTQYILWGGGALIVLVVLHGLWINVRGRLARRARMPVAPLRPAEQMSMNFDDEFDPGVLEDGYEGVEPEDAAVEDGGWDGGAVLRAATEQKGKRPGRRIPVAGRRTEPTVPRGDRRSQDDQDAESGPAPEAPSGQAGDAIGDVIVIWVFAKASETFAGPDLLRALMDNDLHYSRNVFRKLDPNTRRQRFTVANGVEPGTFDLTDPDALVTPRLVFLLRLATLADPMPAFEDMLEVAQNVATQLRGDLKDEHTNDLSGQTLEHCRQRIREFKRRELKQQAQH